MGVIFPYFWFSDVFLPKYKITRVDSWDSWVDKWNSFKHKLIVICVFIKLHFGSNMTTIRTSTFVFSLMLQMTKWPRADWPYNETPLVWVLHHHDLFLELLCRQGHLPFIILILDLFFRSEIFFGGPLKKNTPKCREPIRPCKWPSFFSKSVLLWIIMTTAEFC
jgi:hypothetical protein